MEAGQGQAGIPSAATCLGGASSAPSSSAQLDQQGPVPLVLHDEGCSRGRGGEGHRTTALLSWCPGVQLMRATSGVRMSMEVEEVPGAEMVQGRTGAWVPLGQGVRLEWRPGSEGSAIHPEMALSK